MKQKTRDLISVFLLVVAVTALHYFTISRQWAIHDFYRRLYYIPIIIASFKFRLKGGVITSVIVSFLYSPHIFIYSSYEDVGMVNQILEIVLFLFIGSITGYLVEQLYRNNLLLTEQLERITDMETLNENILDSMKNVLIALDSNQNVRIINQLGRKVFSYINPGTSFESVNNIGLKSLNTSVKEVLKGERPMILEAIKVEEKNEVSTYKSWVYPLKDHNDQIQGAVIILEDISVVSKLEREVRRAEKLSAIGMMASGIAHEIRNPLGIIKTIAQTLKLGDNQSESENDGLDIIIDEVDRSNHVIKELLDFSKPEKGLMTLCELHELTDEMLRISRPYAEQKQVQIVNDVKKAIHSKIVKEKIKQALLNLILNAVDAMPDGGIILISGYSLDSQIYIEIKDDGIGIAEEDLDKVFNPFFTTRESGTGLGLAITHKIIEEHQGRISVHSQVGKGTTFVVELPVNLEGEIDET